MDADIISSNILRLRKERGESQGAVASAAGLTRATLSAIEQGRSTPAPDTVRRIARALKVPLRDLVTPVPRLRRVRFRSLKRLKSREQILVEAARWLHDFDELEQLLGDRRPHALGPLWDRVDTDRMSVAEIAAAAREHFGLGPREPVHDVCGLLESRGIKVHPVAVANDAFLGLSVAEDDGGPAVIVNTWDRLAVEHWIYSAAHELGHLVMHLAAYDVSIVEEDARQEREAEGFASHFLMPDAVFWDEWRDAAGLGLYDRVLKVKRVFRVSWRAALYRVGERLPKDEARRLWVRMSAEHRRRTGRRLLKLTEPDGVDEEVFRSARPVAGAEPAGLDVHDFQGDRLAALVRRGVESEEITLARGAELIGLSVAEMRELAASWVP
jgi:Zn-dependent peptidase ImmA (M78 family)/transcriptional regulator with XRE-family HTH domain